MSCKCGHICMSEPEIVFVETINDFQYQDLLIFLDGYPDIVEEIFRAYKIKTLKDIPKSNYHKCIARIEEIKRTIEASNRRT
jgi:hypothetical protein